MKIACYTDLHGCLPNKVAADLAIFSGDIIGHNPRGMAAGNSSDFEWQVKYLFGKVLPYFKTFDCPVVFIAGNHDLLLDKLLSGHFWHHKSIDVVAEMLEDIQGSNVHYLNRSGIELCGKKIWGSPYVPYISDRWAFQYPRWSEVPFANTLYQSVPTDTDILITHGPPAGILASDGCEKDYGCPTLARFLNYAFHPQLHVFGHSHVRGTNEEYPLTKFVNGAISGKGRDDYADETGNPYVVQSMDPIIMEIA